MTALPGATRIRAGRSAAEGFDVIVIGAGVAGLSAAETLAAHGARVLILEARNRIGGRIHAVAAPGWELPVPLGAEFVHGPDPELEELCDRAALTREPVEEIHWRAENGRLIPVPDFWERVDAALQGIGPAFAGSFADWLHQEAPQLSATTRRDLRHFVSGFHAAELERMSAATLYRAAQSEEEQSRLELGFGALVQAIAARLPADRVTIKLSSPVSRISWKPHAVTVISGAAASQWRAPAVIVTVPLGVLQQDGQSRGGITFEPMLDDRLGLWRQLGVGHVQRIVMRFDPSFWADPVVPAALREEQGKRFGFIHSDESPFPVWWALAPHPILVGWWGGPEAKVASTWTAAELRARALRTLSRLIGVTVEQLDRRLVDWRHHDWTADIYAQGAYSFATAGLEAAARQSGEPVADTLFFAGEAFADPESMGTVQAARKSGRSVAESVVQSLRSTRGRAIR